MRTSPLVCLACVLLLSMAVNYNEDAPCVAISARPMAPVARAASPGGALQKRTGLLGSLEREEATLGGGPKSEGGCSF